MTILLQSCLVILAIALFTGAPLWFFSGLILALLYALLVPQFLLFVCAGILLLFNVRSIRRVLVTSLIFYAIKVLKFLPVISQTEKEAIEAGSVWIDAELFSGKPDFKRILSQDYPSLTDEEQAFMDGPVESLCAMVEDWDVYQKRDFTEQTWDYMKKEKFFSLIIPKKYGGLGFSALANSAIVAKLSSRSTPLGITVMVPNSLGPAELLVHYGTEQQKNYYLPRLAIGEDIPCFALTEPGAGSDAGAMLSKGEIFKSENGSLMIRLNWNKRYITLGAKATILGLAFKCVDPKGLLGNKKDLGITCALIPYDTAGVEIGNRHDPLGVPFYNCPMRGVDVEIPITSVIGAEKGIGKGWSMLMESLSAGRGISLPANCTGGTMLVARAVGAYSMLRQQFGIEIGKFEGIQAPLADIAGGAYFLEAARRYTCGALDQGAKPAVVTAITKYHFTEYFRKVINHGMDICGGAGISLGPKNLLAHPYIACPIGVTVEGANILTRTLMIFGQGAIRCHPFALQEIHAVEENNLAKFDKAFWAHIGHVIRNFVRMLLLFVTRGLIAKPAKLNQLTRYYQKLSWISATFAFFADLAMILFGGNLKRKENITGRFGDILSWMYVSSAVMKRYEAEGSLKEDLPLVLWSLQLANHNMQQAFLGLFDNMGILFKIPKFLFQINSFGSMPSDELSLKVAMSIQKPGKQRDRLTDGMFIPKEEEQHLAKIEKAFLLMHENKDLYKKLLQAQRKKQIRKADTDSMIQAALACGVFTEIEASKCLEVEALRREVISVDEYTQEEYIQRSK